MGCWIIGSKNVIFLNKNHRNTHGTDKIDHVSQAHHPITPSLHYSDNKILRQSRRTLTWPKGAGFSGQNKLMSPRVA